MGEVDTHLNHGVEEEASYSSTSSVLLLLHQYQLQLPPFSNATTPNCCSMYSSDYHRLKKLSSSITTTNKNRLTSEISQVQVSMKFPLRQEIDITRNDFQGNS
jgi:hypothetical protein